MLYDLEQRTAGLAIEIINLCRVVPKNNINSPLIDQLIRSGTSIGANYTEANGASSKKDFRNKIYLAKKEAMETKYWLKLIANSNNSLKERCLIIWKETHEITLIFSKIISRC